MLGGTYDQDFGSMVDNVAAVGTPDEVTEKIGQYIAAGARHLIFLPATTRTGGFNVIARTLIEDVMPRVRARSTP
jgi:alkanesulfonate monooxygenase SsuD/methylene tetrahydromethanopterin reductase-like flavin-dependent oxidoreductase (luciferase family)